MNILILNGTPGGKRFQPFENFLEEFVAEIGSNTKETTILDLRDLDMDYCTGCWGCWVKKPGECVTIDDTDLIRREYMKADFVVYASPIILGFTSSILKQATDKMIPLLRPNITLVKKECHHVKRYDSYPDFGVLLGTSEENDTRNIDIIRKIYERFALNFHADLTFLMTSESSPKEVADAIVDNQRFATRQSR
jgi:multimeric flavodoxin WrbA